MGGRGASSASNSDLLDMADGGHRSELELPWDTIHPMPLLPENMKAAVGMQGKPINIKNALGGANPNFSRQYREYSENCQRCVVAYEMRRRGFNVTAQPTFETDLLPIGGKWRGAFQHGKREHLNDAALPQARKALDAKMKAYGDGARAFVSFGWKSGGGHVIVAENVKGKVRYFDPQIGKEYNPKTLLRGTARSTVDIMRTDNLRMSSRITKSVWTEGTQK